MQGERFKHLADRFLARTREELVQLHDLLPAAQQGDAQALMTIQQMSHRINGSGAMLGFKQVSEQAAQIEHILRRSDNAPAADEWPIIRAHLNQLAEALRQAEDQSANKS